MSPSLFLKPNGEPVFIIDEEDYLLHSRHYWINSDREENAGQNDASYNKEHL